MFLHGALKTNGDSGGDGCVLYLDFHDFQIKYKEMVSRDAVGFYLISHVNL